MYKNSEGYPDPTSGEALGNIAREERAEKRAALKQEKKYLPKIYVCSPFAGDTEGNIEKAHRYCAFSVEAGALVAVFSGSFFVGAFDLLGIIFRCEAVHKQTVDDALQLVCVLAGDTAFLVDRDVADLVGAGRHELLYTRRRRGLDFLYQSRIEELFAVPYYIHILLIAGILHVATKNDRGVFRIKLHHVADTI